MTQPIYINTGTICLKKIKDPAHNTKMISYLESIAHSFE